VGVDNGTAAPETVPRPTTAAPGTFPDTYREHPTTSTILKALEAIVAELKRLRASVDALSKVKR
jgi:hypothetical protein